MNDFTFNRNVDVMSPDFTLIVSGIKYKISSWSLVNFSPKMRKILLFDPILQEFTIPIEDKAHRFPIVATYISKKEINVTRENADFIRKCAIFFESPKLTYLADQVYFEKATVSNCLSLIDFDVPIEYNEYLIQFIGNNFQELYQTQKFMSLPISYLDAVFLSDGFLNNCDILEDEFFDYISNLCSARNDAFQLFSHVEFDSLSPSSVAHFFEIFDKKLIGGAIWKSIKCRLRSPLKSCQPHMDAAMEQIPQTPIAQPHFSQMPQIIQNINPQLINPQMPQIMTPQISQMPQGIPPQISQNMGPQIITPQISQPQISQSMGPKITQGMGPQISQPQVSQGMGPQITQGMSSTISQPQISQSMGPNITQGMSPSISQPQVSQGMGPQITQGMGPQISQGMGPTISQQPAMPSMSAQISQGMGQQMPQMMNIQQQLMQQQMMQPVMRQFTMPVPEMQMFQNNAMFQHPKTVSWVEEPELVEYQDERIKRLFGSPSDFAETHSVFEKPIGDYILPGDVTEYIEPPPQMFMQQMINKPSSTTSSNNYGFPRVESPVQNMGYHKASSQKLMQLHQEFPSLNQEKDEIREERKQMSYMQNFPSLNQEKEESSDDQNMNQEPKKPMNFMQNFPSFDQIEQQQVLEHETKERAKTPQFQSNFPSFAQIEQKEAELAMMNQAKPKVSSINQNFPSFEQIEQEAENERSARQFSAGKFNQSARPSSTKVSPYNKIEFSPQPMHRGFGSSYNINELNRNYVEEEEEEENYYNDEEEEFNDYQGDQSDEEDFGEVEDIAPISINYTPTSDKLDGIFNYICSEIGNPLKTHLVTMEGGGTSQKWLHSILDRKEVQGWWSNFSGNGCLANDMWLSIAFTKHVLRLTAYTFHCVSMVNGSQPRSWELYGSKNKKTWTLIDERKNIKNMNVKNPMITFVIPKNHQDFYVAYKFKCLQNWSRKEPEKFSLSKLEFFGDLEYK